MKSPTSIPESTTPYTFIDSNDEHKIEHEKPLEIIGLNNQQKKKKKYCNLCIFISLMLGILIYFLFPRKPDAYVNSITINKYDSVYGIFKFNNFNYYNVKWKDPIINLHWIPYNGQKVGPLCYNNNTELCDTNFNYKGYCGIKLGEFKDNVKFNTHALASTKKKLNLINSTQQEVACFSWMALNFYNEKPQLLISSGSVTVNSNIINYGKVNFEKQIYYLTFD